MCVPFINRASCSKADLFSKSSIIEDFTMCSSLDMSLRCGIREMYEDTFLKGTVANTTKYFRQTGFNGVETSLYVSSLQRVLCTGFNGA